MQIKNSFLKHGCALLCLIALFIGNNAFAAQGEGPIDWQTEIIKESDSEGQIILTANLREHQHLYAFAEEGGGVNGFEIEPENYEGVEFGAVESSVNSVFDETEQMAYWDETVSFTIPYFLENKDKGGFKLKLRGQACEGEACTLVKETVDIIFNNEKYLEELQATEKNNLATVEGMSEVSVGAGRVNERLLEEWWAPVEVNNITESESVWSILILGFLGGLAALLTPCVWPMIPMTLSFFLKKGKEKKKSRRDALIYGLSIIIIYLVLGIAITLIFGAGKLNELSTNAIFNIFFFLLLVVFAISFFGAFDIKLPAKWSNVIDSKAEKTSGFISIFFMAFTLALVSFSCTGPIIGTLLVEAASEGNILGPAVGMGGFAFGLALPFSLFAIFPGMVKDMPKSGGWLNTVKVVLGFIELILALKFLSVADMAYQWRILDREVFLVLWIVLFAMLGLYLLGKLRFSHDEKKEHVGIFRFFLSVFSFSFAIYLLPGLWGAPLKAVSAFVPPIETQDFNLHAHNHNFVIYDNYDEGMAFAYENGLPVLLDFSGYGCVNCRNMEVEVFEDKNVREFIADNFVMVKLMVDERTPLPAPYTVTENGKTIEIETVGDKWMYLENHKFGASSQPYYVILDNHGKPMNEPMFYTNSVDRFMEWMQTGLQTYQLK